MLRNPAPHWQFILDDLHCWQIDKTNLAYLAPANNYHGLIQLHAANRLMTTNAIPNFLFHILKIKKILA